MIKQNAESFSNLLDDKKSPKRRHHNKTTVPSPKDSSPNDYRHNLQGS